MTTTADYLPVLAGAISAQRSAQCTMRAERMRAKLHFAMHHFFLRLSHEIIMLQLTMMMICTNMHVVKDRIKIGNVGNFASLE